MGDTIRFLIVVGFISAVGLMFSVFGVFISNPTPESAEMFIFIMAIIFIMSGLSASVWKMFK